MSSAPDGSVRFRWPKAPTSAELSQLAHTIARRVGRFLERRGLLERDAANSYLAGEVAEAVRDSSWLGRRDYRRHHTEAPVDDCLMTWGYSIGFRKRAFIRLNTPFVFATGYGALGLRPPYAAVPTLQKPFRQADLERIIRAGILRAQG